jgi:stage V sporulation protein AC
MNSRKYKQLVDTYTPKENRLTNMLVSFLSGGVIGLIGTFLFIRLNNIYNEDLSVAFTLLILIATISFITAIGKADNLFTKFKCGLIIPITGFAHSIASSIIDYKKEGLINIGSNTFKLAGSVILYGIVSAILLTLVKVILNV